MQEYKKDRSDKPDMMTTQPDRSESGLDGVVYQQESTRSDWMAYAKPMKDLSIDQ